jgi:hypothetical protein
MKNTVRLFGTLGLKLCVVVVAAALCFGLVACDNGTTSSGGNGETTDKAVDLISVEANPGAPTSSLTLKFSADIESLSKENILFTPKDQDLVTVGTLSGTGTTRTLGVTALKAGKLTVSVSKDGYRVAGAKSVDVVLAPPEWERVTLESAVANGSLGADGKAAVTTSKLSFELSKAIPGLTSDNVNVGAGVRKGLLDKTGEASYSINISGFGVDADTGVGTLTVSISKEGYVVEPSKDVAVYVYKRPASGTGTPVDYSAFALPDVHTTKMSLTFDRVVPGLSAENVVLTVVPGSGDGNVIRGELSQPTIFGDGKAQYTLWVYGVFDYGIQVLVDVVKDGYAFSEASPGDSIVTLYYYRESFFGVVAKSDANEEKKTTTVLTLTFGVDPLLVEGDVGTTPGKVQIIGGSTVNGVRVTSFDKVGPGVYEVGIAGFAKDGTLTVKAAVDGINFNPDSVQVGIFYVAEPISSLTDLIGFLKNVNKDEYVTVKIEPPLTLAGVKEAIDPVMLDGKSMKITLDIADNADIKAIGGTSGGTTWPDLASCPNLYGVVLGKYIKDIDTGAFTSSPLKEIILDDVLYLGTGTGVGNGTAIPDAVLTLTGLNVIINADQTESLFAATTKTDMSFVKFGEGIDTITAGLFKGIVATGFTSYTVPEGIKNIAYGAFQGCTSLATLVVEDELVSVVDNTSSTRWPNTLINVTFKKSPAASVKFPVDVKKVTLQGDANVVKANFAIDSNDKSEVTDFTLNGTEAPVFGDFVKTVNVTVGTDYTGTLTGSTFNDLADLAKITVVPTNKSYRNDTTVTDVLLSFDSKTLIKWPQAKTGAALPSNVTIIGPSAFKGFKGTTMALTGVTDIGDNAFESSALTAATIPDSVLSIGKEAFKGCTAIAASALTFTGTPKVASIGDSAFDGCTTITGVVIPNSVETMGTGVFANCAALASATIGTGLTTIPANTFKGDTVLATLTLTGTKITSIGASAFENCDALYTGSGSTFDWPATTNSAGTVQNVSIGDNAFYSGTGGLISITIGGKLASLGEGALPANCATVVVKDAVASTVKFPATVVKVVMVGGAGSVTRDNFSNLIGVTIGYDGTWANKTALATSIARLGAITSLGFDSTFTITTGGLLVGSDFDALTSLTEIVVTGNGTYESTDGVLFTKTVTGPPDTNTLIRYPIAKTGASYTIPAETTSILARAFKDVKNLTTITVAASSGLTTIQEGAFYGCLKLATVTLTAASTLANISTATYTPTGGSTAPLGAFEGVETLTSVLGLRGNIGYNTFKDCTGLIAGTTTGALALTNVTVIGEGAFMGCTAAMEGSDATTGFTTIEIPAALTSIGKNAFNGCTNLKTLTFTTATASSLASIDDGAFAGTKIEAVVFTGSTTAALTRIGSAPVNNVTSVGAFEGVTALESVTLTAAAAGLTLNPNTFRGCTSLAAPTLTGVIAIGNGAFYGCASADFDEIEIPTAVTAIGNDAFRGCTNLEALTLQTGGSNLLETIGNGAFIGTKLSSVDFTGATLKGIGTIPTGNVDGAFEGVTDLEEVIFGTVHSTFIIGKNAFKGCTKLVAPTLAGVVEIGSSAFENCTAAAVTTGTPNDGFTKVTIPTGLNAIGNRAFAATSLVELTLGTMPTGTVGTDVFAGNTNLKELVLNAALNTAIAGKLPITGFETVTLGISQGGFNFKDFTSLENVKTVTGTISIVAGNFGTMNSIKKIVFTSGTITVNPGAFVSTALTDVTFTVNTVTISSTNSFPYVLEPDTENNYKSYLKDFTPSAGQVYDFDKEKGWILHS